MRNLSKLTGAIVAVALSVGSAAAQVTANMSATTTIGASVSVADGPGAIGQLRFGTLAQGSAATTILPSSASAGRFDITGIAAAPLTITFTSLPATLSGPGGQTISMSAYAACYLQSTVNAGCTSQAISVGPSMTGSPALSGTGTGSVFIGATLGAVAPGQSIGAYTGTITISITSP